MDCVVLVTDDKSLDKILNNTKVEYAFCENLTQINRFSSSPLIPYHF